jgi:hypothetical protein
MTGCRKSGPISIIVDFESRFVRNAKSYELIDTIEFEFNPGNIEQIISGVSEGSGIVLSFKVDDGRVRFSLVSNDEIGEAILTGGNFGDGNTACLAKLPPGTPYQLTMGLVFKTPSRFESNYASGTLNIYQLK